MLCTGRCKQAPTHPHRTPVTYKSDLTKVQLGEPMCLLGLLTEYGERFLIGVEVAPDSYTGGKSHPTWGLTHSFI